MKNLNRTIKYIVYCVLITCIISFLQKYYIIDCAAFNPLSYIGPVLLGIAYGGFLMAKIIKLENKKLRIMKAERKLKRNLSLSIKGLVNAVEYRDKYTVGHSKNVSNLAYKIAQKMNLSRKQCNEIKLACLLHDIGKIGIPENILNKPGPLTKEEFDIVKEHPVIGYNILKDFDFPFPLPEIILQHHERLNGSGYPKGLKNDEIKIEAKILAVADTVEAMSLPRPYRKALGTQKALSEINNMKNTHYDPDVVDACISLFKEDNFYF